ncbi:MAG: sel1 repeat family protein [Rhizobiaceae bacterium]|nr:sel1 repeat family protein [Rhizobiaceae bacterium]
MRLPSAVVLILQATAAFAVEQPQAGVPTIVDGPRVSPGESAEPAPDVDRRRFGTREDIAYGAFQRGLYITALNLALPRARDGDAAAQTLAAEILSRGLGVKRDEAEAAKWYQSAAEQNVPEAQFQYALMLLDGRYVGKDPDQAFALMEEAANSGNRYAQFNFAQLLLDRARSADDEKRAAEYFEMAANSGLADAQFAMAQLRANGSGGRDQDLAAARRWLELAARANFDTAQLEYGTWLVEGRGGKLDEPTGFQWIQRAAQSGNVAAQSRLAKLHYLGLGTAPDTELASAWYILARRAGLADPMLEDMLEGLSEEQRRRAIARANRLP